jgi:hypothetical protein
MRLPIARRLRPLQKLLLRASRVIFGVMPGAIVVMSYRKSYFGTTWAACMQESMRKARHWSIGEIELMASFTSSRNSCAY